jgi:hypothetical protein
MVWAVQFGSYIEKFALDWHAKKTHCKLTRRGEVVTHPKFSHVSCTLDAFCPDTNTVIDVKAPGQWRKLDDIIQYYTPQMIVQRACVDAGQASLLIVHGGSEPTEYPVEFDAAYEHEVFNRIATFWQCVEEMTPPFDVEPSLAPVPAIIEYDFSTNNEWCNEAGIWLENKEASKKFTDAAVNIKKHMPADGIIATGGGITVSRNKAGSLTIKEK